VHIVAIYDWKEETAEVKQAISAALGITVYEVGQRLLAGSPLVLASFADSQQAQVLVKKLNQIKIATLVVDTEQIRSRANNFIVQRFKLHTSSLSLRLDDGQLVEIPYGEINILIPVTSIVDKSETKTVTEHRFSLGRTIITGGIPMTEKIKYKQEIRNINIGKLLYLYARGKQQPLIFNQSIMVYNGLGSAMKTSQEQNFTYLINELHRLCPWAVYDDRLFKRIGQSRLLGPTLNPETNLDIAIEILVQYLRVSTKNNNTKIP